MQATLSCQASWRIRCLLSAAVVLGALAGAEAAVYDLQPGTLSQPGSLNAILSAQPGDTFILHATATERVYGRVYTATSWNGKGGSATGGWVTIKGAEGEPRPLINYTGGNNVFEMPSVKYMKFQYLEINGGSDTFKFSGTSHDITLEDVYMHDVTDGMVNASSVTELYNLVVRDCEIARSAYSSTGEAFYLGKHDQPFNGQVHDSLIERNWIHDVVEGVEIKAGCTNITVRDNVISANRNAPSMTIYGTYKADNELRYRIYRNFIYSSTDSGIQCTSDAEITNNVIVNSLYYGMSIRARNLDGKMQNITIANNTFYRAGTTCLNVSNGNIATNVVIANNAFYQDSPAATAFNAAQGIAGITLAGNLYYGTANASSAGLVLGAGPAEVFLNPSTSLAEMDLYPLAGGPLIDAASETYAAANDFNGVARPQGVAGDIGAYEAFHANNPGWKIAAGFKTVGVAGDLDGDGHVDVIDLLTFIPAFGASIPESEYDPACDFNGDGSIDVLDLLDLIANFGM